MLEKILEEIIEQLKAEGCIIDNDAGNRAEEIIRKHMNDGWISVEKELPPNAKHEGTFCPKYQVMTKYGVTEGWYNPYRKGWYILMWFMTGRCLDSEVDFDRGDVPRVVFLSDEFNNEANILTAWQPLSQPYCSERRDNDT